MAVAFAFGFFLIWALPIYGPEAPMETALLDRAGSRQSSTHFKLPELVVDPPAQVTILRPPISEWQTYSTRPIVPPSVPISRPLTRLVAFTSSPFPYAGQVPRTDKPFLNFQEEGRQAHKTFSGRVYWADKTYSDRRVLLHMPKGFNVSKPGVIVLFFHGHGATLERDVAARQRVPAQISESGVNAILVAPQFAVDARDSSAGNFWQPGGTKRFLHEVADKLAEIQGDPATRQIFAKMPVVIVGYSGGYVPTAWSLARGGIDDRVKGVVLLDGLYGEVDKFASWIAGGRSAFFLSAFTDSTRKGNSALQEALQRKGIPFKTEIEASLKPGSITFIEADEEHRDYVTRAWATNPISDVLWRMSGPDRLAGKVQSAPFETALAE